MFFQTAPLLHPLTNGLLDGGDLIQLSFQISVIPFDEETSIFPLLANPREWHVFANSASNKVEAYSFTRLKKEGKTYFGELDR